MTHALILYWSSSGNTEKVAVAIKDGLEDAGIKVCFLKTTEASDIDYFDTISSVLVLHLFNGTHPRRLQHF